MTDNLIVLKLEEEEAELLKAQDTIVKKSSVEAANKAYAFARVMTDMVNAVNGGTEAQNELLRLYKRIAKSRARQPEDIKDVDILNGTITFQKTPKELAREAKDEEDAEDDAVPEGD